MDTAVLNAILFLLTSGILWMAGTLYKVVIKITMMEVKLDSVVNGDYVQHCDLEEVKKNHKDLSASFWRLHNAHLVKHGCILDDGK